MTTPNHGPNRSEILETENAPGGENRNQNGGAQVVIDQNKAAIRRNPHSRVVLDHRSAPYYPLGHSASLTQQMPAAHHNSYAYNQPNPAMERSHQYAISDVHPNYAQPQFRSPHINDSPMIERPATHHDYPAAGYNRPHHPVSNNAGWNGVRRPQMETRGSSHQRMEAPASIHRPYIPSLVPLVQTPAATNRPYNMYKRPNSVPQHHPSSNQSMHAGWNSLRPVQQSMHGTVPYRPGIGSQYGDSSSSRPKLMLWQQQQYVILPQQQQHIDGEVYRKYRGVEPVTDSDFFTGSVHNRSYRPESPPPEYKYMNAMERLDYDYTMWMKHTENELSKHDRGIDAAQYIPRDLEGETSESVSGHCEICDLGLGVKPPADQGEQHRSSLYSSSGVLIYPEVSVLPCGHTFHSECLEQVVGKGVFVPHPPCPTCPRSPKEEDEEVSDITRAVQSLDITKNST